MITRIHEIITDNSLSSISFDEPVTKTYFFHKLAKTSPIPVIYLDFDLLYGGYVASKILTKSDNVTLCQFTSKSILDIFANLMDTISQNQHVVILDSLNGFFAALADEKDSGRIINNLIMLLVTSGFSTESSIVVGSISKFKKDEGWVLSAIGRHVISIDKMNTISIRKQNSNLQLIQTDNLNAQKLSLPISDLDIL